ncbi:hypothetical protein [Methylophaga sulfidovorans]|uniref:O-antigen ligase like membrane protein n=1 Tax=Methylophaga sulfidovorans TaxID=45496 RepID=A0A1I3XMW3_9GAMM|nr:hypothetical protein [Methylophaga sulfidovorans]SFK20818.1 hypothetical protein SAMN04488079_106157 [Methylophaga sulfidovorans]
MPNFFAYLVICFWPLFVIFLIRRYGHGIGSFLSYLLAYMFLPASFAINLPGVPALDKFTITSITIILYFLVSGKRIGFQHLTKPMMVVFFSFMAAPFLTSLTNKSPYLFMPGLSLYDGLSQSITGFLYFFPFFIGISFFRDEMNQIKLFQYLSIAAFFYAFLALYEIRMSPQLHVDLYGYFPHSFLQQYREGGFRAVLFMGHGLLVAMFLALGFGTMGILRKAKIRIFNFSTNFAIALLFITLILSKSYASFVFALFVYLSIHFINTKWIHRASAMIAIMFITYPFLSTVNLFPHNGIVKFSEYFSEERAQSLDFRFKNEQALLAHANEKSWFGWGGWGRNRIYDEESGKDISVTDGTWIITLGTYGWLGFLSRFLFIVVPLLYAYREQRRIQNITEQEKLLLAGHSLLVSIILLDQIPNSSLNSLYWLIIGSLFGRVQSLSQRSKSFDLTVKKTNFVDTKSKKYIN